MATAEAWPPPDPLGEALHFLRMDGAFYCRSELSAPWGMTLDPMPGYLWFHVVTNGAVLLEVDDEHSRWLRAGDVTLVPHGNGHALRSEPGVPAPGVMELDMEHPSDRYEIIRAGGGGTPTTLICGAVRFDHPVARNLVGILPHMIHIGASEGPRATWMRGVFELMAAEAREFQAGGEAVITRLADVLVIQAIRSWIETAPAARTGWLGALQDPEIGRALALIHREPAREWTVASLASELALSRSAFAARFTELVDEPAIRYVTRWRMQVARDALETEDATVAELADRLGYKSEAAFARAFKRVTGMPPGAVKRTASASAA
jgi:AraC-like DNA-binding protein